MAWGVLALYLLFLTVTALVAQLKERRSKPNLAFATTNFTILVPAHNEALVITDCLKSLLSFHYPAGLWHIVLVADNCTDNTAELGRSLGVTVYERFDPEKRGKGYALDWAMRRVLERDGGWTDAVVIFDADTQAHPDFLGYMDEQLRTGNVALQGHYDVLNPFDNWRTSLLYSALLLHNRLRPLARQALGWTTLLKGNGMCFARSVIERFGWNAYSLAEDIEYTTKLMNRGITVRSVPQAVLYAQAARTGKQADSQRMRWEGGRFALIKRDTLPLLRAFIRTRSIARLDWAIDLLTPPMAILIGMPLMLLVVNAALAWLWGGPMVLAGWVWLTVLASACVYVLGGMLICGAKPKAYLYLLCTPLFLVWKVKIYALMLMGRGARGWVRTERTTISSSS